MAFHSGFITTLTIKIVGGALESGVGDTFQLTGLSDSVQVRNTSLPTFTRSLGFLGKSHWFLQYSKSSSSFQQRHLEAAFDIHGATCISDAVFVADIPQTQNTQKAFGPSFQNEKWKNASSLISALSRTAVTNGRGGD